MASTEELHEKISELCCRVRELEDALRESHSQLASDVHPLLTEDMLRIKMPLQRESSDPNRSDENKDDLSPDVVDSFGSISISQTGKTKFYGHTANSWVSWSYIIRRRCDESNALHPSLSTLDSLYFS